MNRIRVRFMKRDYETELNEPVARKLIKKGEVVEVRVAKIEETALSKKSGKKSGKKDKAEQEASEEETSEEVPEA